MTIDHNQIMQQIHHGVNIHTAANEMGRSAWIIGTANHGFMMQHKVLRSMFVGFNNVQHAPRTGFSRTRSAGLILNPTSLWDTEALGDDLFNLVGSQLSKLKR